MAKYANAIVIPVLMRNPTDRAIQANFSVQLPEGWTFRRQLPASISIEPHRSVSLELEVKTPGTQTSGWKMVTIAAKANDKPLDPIRMRIELNSGAMPQ